MATRNLTAVQAYEEEYNKVLGLIGDISIAAEKHFDKLGDNPRNWGFHGDMVAARELLEQALQRLNSEKQSG